MCLVRLLNFLKLNKITQLSFAEYHSKRNFVERVHAEENRVLSKHGPFCSTPIHKHVTVGSKWHAKNMERVAGDMRKCIIQGSFGGKPLLCYRGIKTSEFVFDDEKQMHDFLFLNEERKRYFLTPTYFPSKGEILDCLVATWDVDEHFQGEYLKDHQPICNTLYDGIATCWADRYSKTTIHAVWKEATINSNQYLIIFDDLEQERHITYPWKR